MDRGHIERLIAECLAWRQFYDMPIELVVIDTFSAATTGADENSGRDIGPVLERGRRVCMETGAHVALVHHIPKGGSTPRGHGSLTADFETTIEYEKAEGRKSPEGLDVYRATVRKQRLMLAAKPATDSSAAA